MTTNRYAGVILCVCLAGMSLAAKNSPAAVAPVAMAEYRNAGELLVLSAGGQLLFLDADGHIARSENLHTRTTGMALREDTAYVTTEEPAGQVLAVALPSGKVARHYRVGNTPVSPVLSGDGHRLFVANRFDNTVSLLNLETGESRVVRAIREPMALALSPDGSRLFVANLLPEVRPFLDDENPFIAAQVTVIDTNSGEVLKHIELPNGSQSLRGIAVSPDGRYAVVTHVLSNWTIPTMDIEGGIMNRNAISMIDAAELQWAATIVLDEPDRGAANPWAIAFSIREGSPASLVVTHAGTHEISVIDWQKLLARIVERGTPESYFDGAAFSMLEGIRQRIPLPVNGPRTLGVCEKRILVSGYFSNAVAELDLSKELATTAVNTLSLSPPSTSAAWLGERYFNDATSCFQGWQSCASCHPDGRSDALYWDLLNDGMGNTKNTKSLLMATLTPPAMWRGVRADASAAVRAGIKHIQFATPTSGQAEAIEAYLEEMESTPSPYLDADHIESPKTEDASCAKCHNPGVPRGTLTEAARRGKALFEGKAGCVACHPHPYFTTMQTVDPGLGSGVLYDIPSLVGVWRTAPYLHSGDALTIEETITDFNYLHRRGNTHELSEAELADLVAYVRSL